MTKEQVEKIWQKLNFIGVEKKLKIWIRIFFVLSFNLIYLSLKKISTYNLVVQLKKS